MSYNWCGFKLTDFHAAVTCIQQRRRRLQGAMGAAAPREMRWVGAARIQNRLVSIVILVNVVKWIQSCSLQLTHAILGCWDTQKCVFDRSSSTDPAERVYSAPGLPGAPKYISWVAWRQKRARKWKEKEQRKGKKRCKGLASIEKKKSRLLWLESFGFIRKCHCARLIKRTISVIEDFHARTN